MTRWGSRLSELPAGVRSFFRDRGVADGSLVLVAFSGGADSTALLAAVCEAGYRCLALHCNFHLRGEESNRDEAFSRSVAERLGCGIEVVHFNVGERCRLTGESVEMACRELRYRWFAEVYNRLAAGNDAPACVAVAHHRSDNVETFFLNLLRGSGLKGLAAIPQARGIFVRPLLDVGKNDILAYLQSRGFGYVVDSSNLTDDYKRNKLRNKVLPDLEAAFPGAGNAVARAVGNLRRDSSLLDALVERCGRAFRDADGAVDVGALAREAWGETMLYHMLGGRLAFADVRSVFNSVAESGRWFHGVGGVRFLLDRGRLVECRADEAGCNSLKPVLSVARLSACDFKPDRSGNVIWMDGSVMQTDRADWRLRLWRHGDRIRPFGMKGSRLVSDLLTDAKMPLDAKRNVWVLEYGQDIAWVVGVRASRMFAVTSDSREVIRIEADFRG